LGIAPLKNEKAPASRSGAFAIYLVVLASSRVPPTGCQ
jgi:hypothetical protein